MLVVLNVFAIPVFANIARVSARIMVPIVIVLCVIGTFSVNGSIVETWIMLGCGVIGFFMKLLGYSPAATLIALVLGPLAEETLRQSLIIAGPSIFYTRSMSLLLLIVIGFLIAIPLALSVYRRSTRDR
jgi:putative tricarboxylic transport membrane protein